SVETLSGTTFSATGTAGEYAVTLPLTKVGRHHLKAMVGSDRTSGEVPVEVTQPDSADAADSVTLEASENSLKVGDSTVLTVTVEDRYGNRVTGLSGSDIGISGALTGQDVSSLSW
ncbi:hypothetical protein, partial [Intestinirhabdus alba]|uniref:hypothetical protein n=1 Tax=Intestinirhabdus alba TaxID=2899544 RepID=UPI00142EF79D